MKLPWNPSNVSPIRVLPFWRLNRKSCSTSAPSLLQIHNSRKLSVISTSLSLWGNTTCKPKRMPSIGEVNLIIAWTGCRKLPVTLTNIWTWLRTGIRRLMHWHIIIWLILLSTKRIIRLHKTASWSLHNWKKEKMPPHLPTPITV